MALCFHTAAELRGLDRRRLQSLAKQHNIRANAKSRDIIQKLLALQPSSHGDGDENSGSSHANIEAAGGGALSNTAAVKRTSSSRGGEAPLPVVGGGSAPLLPLQKEEPKEDVPPSVAGTGASGQDEIARLRAENATLRERLRTFEPRAELSVVPVVAAPRVLGAPVARVAGAVAGADSLRDWLG